MVLVGGGGHQARESRQRLGGAADAEHDAEEDGEDADRVVVGLVRVGDEVVPPVQVGEFLHDPQRVRVVLRQVCGDRGDHREAAGDARREGDGGRLVGFVGDCLFRKAVEHRQGNARRRGVGVEGARDDVVARVNLGEFLAQELVAADAHAREANDLGEEV